MESFGTSLLSSPIADLSLADASFDAQLATPLAAPFAASSCGCKFFLNS